MLRSTEGGDALKRIPVIIASLAIFFALIVAVAPTAQAESAGRHPASLLIYPIFDSKPGAGTVISVTNVSTDTTIRAHFIYIDAENNWQEFNRFEPLTPRDTYTTLAKAHVSGAKRGFLFIVAEDFSGNGIVANYLIGDEITVDSYNNFLYAVEAIPFCAKAGGSPNRSDDKYEFNGEEYFKVSDKMYVSSFLGNDRDLSTTFIFVALVPGDYLTRLDFTPYNNDEEEFSLGYEFQCWSAVRASDIDPEFFTDWYLKNRTSWDNRYNGLPWTSGWIEIDGDEAVPLVGGLDKIEDPAFVGAVVQALGYTYAAGHLFHESLEDNPTNGVIDI
jgi:hypothetical protein